MDGNRRQRPREDRKVMRQLEALMAKEASLRGNSAPHSQHEAEATAKAIQRLLLRHHLSMSDLEVLRASTANPVDAELFSPEEHGVRNAQKRMYWQEELAAVVSYAHLCTILVVPTTNLVFFVGRKEDREVCAYAYGMLLRFADSRSLHEHQRARARLRGQPGASVGYRNSWLRGFNLRIAQRYRELEAAMVQQALEQNAALSKGLPGGTGITNASLVTRLDAVRDDAQKWVRENVALPEAELTPTPATDLDGLGDGYRAGGEPALGVRGEIGRKS